VYYHIKSTFSEDHSGACPPKWQ